MRIFSTVILLLAAIFVTTSVSAQMIPFGFWQPQSLGGLCPSGGVSYNGYCYYTGGDRSTCTAYCTSIGKTCDATGTQAATADSASCIAVAGALGWTDEGGAPFSTTISIANSAGCYLRVILVGAPGEEEPITRLYRGTSAQNCTTPPPGASSDLLRWRACACN